MPTPAQRLASQLGDVYLVQAFPLVSAVYETGERAHAQGLYAGITYTVSGGSTVLTAAIWKPVIRGRRR